MTLPEIQQLLSKCKIKVASCIQLSDRRFEVSIEPYPGDPRTLTDKLYKAAVIEERQTLGSITWQWNGSGKPQTLWLTFRVR